MQMRRRFIIGGMITAGLITSAMIALVVWASSAQRDLETAYEAWLTAGGPSSLAAATPTPVPDEENAALIFDQVFGYFRGEWDEMREIRTIFDDALQGEIDAARIQELLMEMDEPLRLVETGAGLSRCRWNLAGTVGPEALPGLHGPIAIVQLLCLRALLEWQHADLDSAERSLAIALVLSERIAQPTGSVVRLIQAELDGIVLRTVEVIYRDRGMPSANLLSLIERRDYRADIAYRIMVDGLVSIGFHQAAVDRVNVFEDDVSPGAINRRIWPGWATTRAEMLNSFRTVGERLSQQPHQRSEAITADPPDLSQWFISFDLHAEYDAAVSYLEAMRAVALAAFQLREEYGHAYPNEWVAPIHPETGEPMDYRRTEDGFVIEGSDIYDWPVRWEWR